jgi:hypothetical protein
MVGTIRGPGMKYTYRKMRLIRTIVMFCAASLIVLTAACGSSSSSDSSASGGPTAEPSSQVAVPTESVPVSAVSSSASNTSFPVCGNGGYLPVNFDLPNGQHVATLTACTNRDESETTIDNPSFGAVWVITNAAVPHPVIHQTYDPPYIPDILFNDFVLEDLSNPMYTIDPGAGVTLEGAPDTIRIQEYTSYQSAWELSSLLGQTLLSKTATAVENALQTRGSPLSQAVFTCLGAAYKWGQGNSQAQDVTPQTIQAQLSQASGIYTAGSSCANDIEIVAETFKKEGEAPTLTLPRVQEATKEGEWEDEDAGKFIDDAIHDAEDVSGHIRK